MHFTLRQLEGRLLRCQIETTQEKDDQGRWVWRDKDGQPSMWSTGSNERTMFVPVETLAEAHGVRFLCPKSFEKNGGPKGTHGVYIFFKGSPHAGRNAAGQEVRWEAKGTTLDDLVVTPSIQEQDEGAKNPCLWHGFVGSNGIPPGHAG